MTLANSEVWPEGVSEELKKICLANGFYSPRIIDGRLCALHDYMVTVGIVVGITEFSHERRYCYEFKHQAVEAFEKFNDVNEHASGLWIKCKGKFRGQIVDLWNPLFAAHVPSEQAKRVKQEQWTKSETNYEDESGKENESREDCGSTKEESTEDY